MLTVISQQLLPSSRDDRRACVPVSAPNHLHSHVPLLGISARQLQGAVASKAWTHIPSHHRAAVLTQINQSEEARGSYIHPHTHQHIEGTEAMTGGIETQQRSKCNYLLGFPNKMHQKTFKEDLSPWRLFLRNL